MNTQPAEVNTGIHGFIYFFHLGFHYRTNITATYIEARDGSKWNRTGSVSVYLAALEAIRAASEIIA